MFALNGEKNMKQMAQSVLFHTNILAIYFVQVEVDYFQFHRPMPDFYPLSVCRPINTVYNHDILVISVFN